MTNDVEDKVAVSRPSDPSLSPFRDKKDKSFKCLMCIFLLQKAQAPSWSQLSAEQCML